jgi:hypothetical protein
VVPHWSSYDDGDAGLRHITSGPWDGRKSSLSWTKTRKWSRPGRRRKKVPPSRRARTGSRRKAMRRRRPQLPSPSSTSIYLTRTGVPNESSEGVACRWILHLLLDGARSGCPTNKRTCSLANVRLFNQSEGSVRLFAVHVSERSFVHHVHWYRSLRHYKRCCKRCISNASGRSTII